MYFSRGPNKIQHPLTLVDIYESYKAEVKAEGIYDVDYKTFIGVWTDYIRATVSQILFKGKKFKMPFSIGTLQIIKKKPIFKYESTLPIDWKTTNAIGKKVIHMNDHTGGFKFLFKWLKVKAMTTNKNLYAFKATRELKRTLARIILHKEQDFFEYNKVINY